MIYRSSLLLRFFIISVLIAACSIAVTAWLATQTTASTIEQQADRNSVEDARLYDELLGYAAVHSSWAAVRPTLDALAEQSGRRIALTTPERTVIADTAGRNAPPLPLQRDALIDPLHVDPTLLRGTSANLVDRRAVAALAPLASAYRRDLHAAAARLLDCIRGEHDVDARLAFAPNGRPTVVVPAMEDVFPGGDTRVCLSVPIDDLVRLTPAEEETNRQFRQGVADCLSKAPPSPAPPSPSSTKPTSSPSPLPTTSAASDEVTASAPTPTLTPALTESIPELMPAVLWTAGNPDYSERLAVAADASMRKCFTTALHQQLTGHVAPPALVFLTAPHGPKPATADLSTAGTTRIALTAAVVLAVAMFAAWLAAAQLVRPLRAVTSAAHRMAGGDRRARVERRARGEVGELADAFNAMSEQLERTENQRQALISDVAHELRNPLGNITGWLEATHDGLATADPELIEMLLNESVLLQYLVNDLQDLAQADAGKLRLHPELIDARDVVDQVTAAHQATADERQVALRSMTRGQLLLVADPARLRQAIGNLVSNAVRYTPPGGEVTVRARAGKDGIRIEVIDTGCGIAVQDLPRVFDRFWRSDASRSRRTGGSGLGLAITKHLCEAHGGRISVTSVVGSGTTFCVILPTQLKTDTL